MLITQKILNNLLGSYNNNIYLSNNRKDVIRRGITDMISMLYEPGNVNVNNFSNNVLNWTEQRTLNKKVFFNLLLDSNRMRFNIIPMPQGLNEFNMIKNNNVPDMLDSIRNENFNILKNKVVNKLLTYLGFLMSSNYFNFFNFLLDVHPLFHNIVQNYRNIPTPDLKIFLENTYQNNTPRQVFQFLLDIRQTLHNIDFRMGVFNDIGNVQYKKFENTLPINIADDVEVNGTYLVTEQIATLLNRMARDIYNWINNNEQKFNSYITGQYVNGKVYRMNDIFTECPLNKVLIIKKIVFNENRVTTRVESMDNFFSFLYAIKDTIIFYYQFDIFNEAIKNLQLTETIKNEIDLRTVYHLTNLNLLANTNLVLNYDIVTTLPLIYQSQEFKLKNDFTNTFKDKYYDINKINQERLNENLPELNQNQVEYIKKQEEVKLNEIKEDLYINQLHDEARYNLRKVYDFKFCFKNPFNNRFLIIF